MRRPGLGLATLVVLAVVAAGLSAPAVAPLDPAEQNVIDRLAPPVFMEGGTREHWLGTDHLGRDVLSRLIYGARVAVIVGITTVIVSGIVGLGVGLAAGYFGGWTDTLFMRLLDVQLSMPFMLLALTIIGILGPSLRNIVIVLALTGWVVYARVVRAEILSLRTREFVAACRSLGGSDARIILTHLLPNVRSSVMVVSTVEVARMMLLESALSFLGLGVRPPTPSWGAMLADGRIYLTSAWWLAAFPGLAISVTVLAVNTVGDRLRDYLDPELEV
ncbi:MAG TPA: ABC transporter permease [Candidatus Eisenbacteria bacterium]|nr:ABC transporter permease [Candidatus Eisenbacteria bacterium]